MRPFLPILSLAVYLNTSCAPSHLRNDDSYTNIVLYRDLDNDHNLDTITLEQDNNVVRLSTYEQGNNEPKQQFAFSTRDYDKVNISFQEVDEKIVSLTLNYGNTTKRYLNDRHGMLSLQR